MRWGIVVVLVFTKFLSFGQNATDIIPVLGPVPKKPNKSEMDLGDLTKSLLKGMNRPILPEKGKKVYFNFLPLSLNPPGGGDALITSTQAGFYLGSHDSTHLSTATFAPYWNFGSQFGLPLRANIWLDKNKGLIDGDIRFLFYPQYTWGLGNGKNESQKLLVHYTYLRTYLTAYKSILPYLYLGIGFSMDYHIHISSPDSSLAIYSGYSYGTGEGSNSISLSPNINFLFDERNTRSKTMPFSYLHFIYRQNLVKNIGISSNWSSMYIDIRRYLPLGRKSSKQNLLAFRSFFWNVFGRSTPYLDLPSLGWDPYERSGRGIEQNRYRGKALWYFESEYRKDLTDNGLLGFVVFANINSALVPESGNFETFHPAFGAGLRFKISKITHTNLAVDYALSQTYSGFWLALGEAF